jgi:hypothetical protein
VKNFEHRTVDKHLWGPGPWQQEPDKRQWKDVTTGLPCFLVRGRNGALCGYVGVTEGHPWFGRHKYEIDAEVHGGVTFALACERDGEWSSSICHQPDEGEPDKLWWVGFDCAHSLDLLPSQPSWPLRAVDFDLPRWAEPVYRDLSYVERHVGYLALEAASAKTRALSTVKG